MKKVVITGTGKVNLSEIEKLAKSLAENPQKMEIISETHYEDGVRRAEKIIKENGLIYQRVKENANERN